MIRVFFGNPGSGKTTAAVRQCSKLLKKSKKNGIKHIYSNFECKLCNQVSLADLGKWTFPPDSYVFIDEAGIEYNSRKFKSLSQEAISWFKTYRHYGVRCIDVFSQSWEDMDITLRRLADELWYIRRLGPFTMLRRIYKRVGIDKESHQIIDMYEFGSLLSCFLPFPFHRTNLVIFPRWLYYKYFDSYERKYLPFGKVDKPMDKISSLRFVNRKAYNKFKKRTKSLKTKNNLN